MMDKLPPIEKIYEAYSAIADGRATLKEDHLCGFSMETEHLLENSRVKLQRKNLDMVAANNVKVAGAGFGVDTNVLTLITADGETELPLMSKDAAADALLDAIVARLG